VITRRGFSTRHQKELTHPVSPSGRIDKEKPKTRKIDRRKTPNKSAEAAQVKINWSRR
jgi:hypothetical protein